MAVSDLSMCFLASETNTDTLFLSKATDYRYFSHMHQIQKVISCLMINALPDMPILGSSSSAADKDKMSKL